MIKKATLVFAVLLALVITAGLDLACSSSTPATTTPTTTKTTATTKTTTTTTASAAILKLPANHAGRTTCLACHKDGITGAPKVPAASHASYTDALCASCHK